MMICTMPFIVMLDDNGLNINERVRHINEIILEIQMGSILPLRLLDDAHMMQDSLTSGCSYDGIHLIDPKAWFFRGISTI